MEDLAHFIKSMSEKYGLLDADNKECREFQDGAGNKQIQEYSSSAASNSYNNEVLGQASSWEYLSIFISGQTLDSNASLGSGHLQSLPVPFHSQDDSHLHTSTRMIDINKEPAPESPLPATSVVVGKEKEIDDMFSGSGSIVEFGRSAPLGKDFPNFVTMSDYLQPEYCEQESSQNLRLPDTEASSEGPCQLQDLTCKSGETSSREDSSSPLPKHQRRNSRFYSRDDHCPGSGDPRCSSHRMESEKSNFVCVEDGQAECVASATKNTTGDVHRQYGSWDLALVAEKQSRRENACAWKPIPRSNNGCQQAQTRSRKQSGVVWSFVGPDDEVESGENVANVANVAISSGRSKSRSCHTEGEGTDTDSREEVYDDSSRARFQMNLGDENSKHQTSNVSSYSNHEEREEVAGGYGKNQHNYCGTLEEEERGSRSLPGRSDALLNTLESGNTMVEEQALEAALGSRSGFAWGETKPKSGFSIPGQQECDMNGDNFLGRNRVAAHTEGNFRLKEQDRGGATASSHNMVSRLRRIQQDYADSIESSQETDPVKGSCHEGRSYPGGIQRLLDDSMPRVEESEHREGSSDDRSIDLGREQDGLRDSIILREQEQRISFHGENNLLADPYQDDFVHGEQDRQLRGHSSAGVYSSSQDLREDSCGLNEEQRSSNGGISSGCRAKSFDHRSDDSISEELEIRRESVSEDYSATHGGYQDKVETSVCGEQESKKVVAHEKKTKNGEKKYVFDSASNYLKCEKLEDLFPSIQDFSSSVMHYRSSQLDHATKKLIADTEAGSATFHSNQGTQVYPGNNMSAIKSTLQASSANEKTFKNFPYVEEDVQPNSKSSSNLKLTKNLELNRKPQTAGSLIQPEKNMGSSYTLEEARFSESWDLGEDFNPPSSASWKSGSMKSKWTYVNQILCDNGFSPLDNSCMSSSPETFGKLFDTLDDVVRNYARREKLVQELLGERDVLRQEDQRNDEVTLKLESDVEMLKQKLGASEQRAELAAAASGKAYAALRKEHQRLEATHASALQRCSQLEHVCRAKERSLGKVQEKIQEAVRREQSQRSRDRELYEKLKHKVAISQKTHGEIIESNFLLRDLKPACIVGIYERQRAATEAEMNQLREENSRLCKELREKENSLLSKAMSAVEADQAELDQREQNLIEQLTQIEKQLTKKISQCRQLDCREDSALLPLAVNQRDVVKNEDVKNQVPLKPDSAENNSSMLLLQRLQSAAAQEGRNSQLLKEIANRKLEYSTTGSNCQTSFVNGCTNVKCQELLQEVCSKVKITDPLRITDAIDSLLKVVTAVPRMESFIDNVCDVVFNEGCMFLTRENSQGVEQTPEAVPNILKFWLQQLRYTEELQQFKDSVCAQLWERYDDKAKKHPMNCKLAEASVKDLINIERHYLLSQQSYREAQTLLKAEPQKLLHRIIGHFQMLFEIPRLEGVMAVMNSVYIQISEYHNFARALCSMLGLPKDSGANTIISTVTGILNKVSNLY